MAEALDFVDVFIREVHAARKSHLSVDEHELAVVAVIEPAGKDGDERVKDVRLNAHLAQLPAVAHRKARDAAEIVVQNANVHALHRLAVQDFQNGIPHLSVVDDEKFEKNIVFGLFELFEHPRVARSSACMTLFSCRRCCATMTSTRFMRRFSRFEIRLPPKSR